MKLTLCACVPYTPVCPLCLCTLRLCALRLCAIHTCVPYMPVSFTCCVPSVPVSLTPVCPPRPCPLHACVPYTPVCLIHSCALYTPLCPPRLCALHACLPPDPAHYCSHLLSVGTSCYELSICTCSSLMSPHITKLCWHVISLCPDLSYYLKYSHITRVPGVWN